MHESNTELVKAAFAAVNRRDPEALAELCTDEVEFRPITAPSAEEPYRGAEGVRRWLAEIDRRFPGFRATPEEMDDFEAGALVSGVTQGPGLKFHWHLAARVAGGLIAAWSFHPSREHAEQVLNG
jgi:ketosteroid isomerase-like protein